MSEVKVKQGDIFYESWGCDQTNIDFCQVIEISPSGKTVLCQMMTQKEVPSEGLAPMSEYVMPDKLFPEDGTFRLYVRSRSNGDVSLVGQYPYCRGDKRMGYFTKWEGRPLYQSHYH